MNADSASSCVVEINGLTFDHKSSASAKGQERILDCLSLSIAEGEIVSILGASGCGKTTLLNLIAGILTPLTGSIKFADEASLRKIGYIAQEDALLPWRTVEQNLMLITDLSQHVKKNECLERVLQYLSAFHLDAHILKKFPSQLSGGMRQRVSIIQSLMFDPQLLLLDEPFSALDFYTKLTLENDIYQLVKAKNKAAILVTHDIEEALAISDRILLMKKREGFIHEEVLDFKDFQSPENIRGTVEFSEIYKKVWSKLKGIIEAQ